MAATSTVASLASAAVSTVSDSLASLTTAPSSTAASSTDSAPASTSTALQGYAAGSGQSAVGISLNKFLGALVVSIAVFGAQMALFLLLRNKLARIFKPKTYLVPERERTEPPPRSPWGLLASLMAVKDREIINKCGLDAYFFLRYLKTLLVIFVPIATIVIPILVPINYVGGRGQGLVNNATSNATAAVTGLDTLAWGNVTPADTHRYWAHLVLAICVVVWVCAVFFLELRVYIKIRQDYLTSAEHRLRASATTVLVSSIPKKWLSEEALMGLFDVFPGGLRNIWLTRDLTKLLEKIQLRDQVHQQLEGAQTDLIRMAKKKQLKKREAEDKKLRKQQNTKALTKEQKGARDRAEDEEAQRRAEAGGGISSGDHEEVPHNISEGVKESEDEQREHEESQERAAEAEGQKVSGFKKFGAGVGKIGDGLLGGVVGGVVGGVGAAGQTFKTIGQGVGNAVDTTNGFMAVRASDDLSAPPTRGSDHPRRAQVVNHLDQPGTAGSSIGAPKSNHSRNVSATSYGTNNEKRSFEPPPFGNTVRKPTDLESMLITKETKFWQFWKTPAGGYASPIPQGIEGTEFPFEEKSLWQKVKAKIPFMGGEEEPTDYPPYYNANYKEDSETPAEWEKWVKKKDRPTHRLPIFSFTPTWLPGLPLINKKVDTIYWCRKELARLNVEIEEDQKTPEKYPLMRSAFIQFNHQIAAHMACQSLVHHVPKHMAPRVNEVSPKDVIWENMALTWWEEWIRTACVLLIIAAMVLLWAIPVAFTATLGQLDALVSQYEFLDFLTKNPTVYKIAGAVAGVLPALLLAILLFLVPVVLNFLAGVQGVKTGSQRTEFVQVYFFIFLFFQVFLVVSISSFFSASINTLVANFQTLTNVDNVLKLLATNLPKAANYFFSYMLLQAMSVSSGTLLQVSALAIWYVIARLFDSTARNKWSRNTTLANITWGSFFPVYTNFACIALIYSIVAPIISLFAIITFGLLWVAQRYSMLYVTRFQNDTGGVLYPRAINQTFTGLYVMELCLAGLFFIVINEHGDSACTPQGVIMLVMVALTAVYQYLLNASFAPLFRYLPITVEDEAVLRDEAFQRAQDKRLGLVDEDEEEGGEHQGLRTAGPSQSNDEGIELQKLTAHRRRGTAGRLAHLNPVKTVGSWAKKEGGQLRKIAALGSRAAGQAAANATQTAEFRRARAAQRRRDLEAQRAIGDALFGGYHDEIEDLTPEERDAMVRHAFQHYALRARRPTVWVPRDDIGVSDDEIRRTQEFSDGIWISNEGTALDSKVRVVYGRNPPDFSEVDLIDL